jgi:ATP-dependent DNA ligase
VSAFGARQAYLDGELCGVFPDGITSFSMIQAASDAGNAAGLVFFLFDLLHLEGDDIGARPLIERKARLPALLSNVTPPLHYSDYHAGDDQAFHAKACELSLEGIVSKRRPWLGALLLAHYDPDGRLVYAGRAGTDINQAELGRLWRKLQPLATDCRGPAAAHQPLLREVVYEGLREDKPASEVRRLVPHPNR